MDRTVTGGVVDERAGEQACHELLAMHASKGRLSFERDAVLSVVDDIPSLLVSQTARHGTSDSANATPGWPTMSAQVYRAADHCASRTTFGGKSISPGPKGDSFTRWVSIRKLELLHSASTRFHDMHADLLEAATC